MISVQGYTPWLQTINTSMPEDDFILSIPSKPYFIARWDSTAWDNLPEQLNRTVTAMAYYRGELYVRGQFTQAGGRKIRGIAKWDGGEWKDIGISVPILDDVMSMVVYDQKLYVAGGFRGIINGDTLGPGIFSFDGNGWELVLDNISGVERLRVLDSALYAVGTFTEINGLRANSIASYRSPTLSNDRTLVTPVFQVYPNPFSNHFFIKYPSHLARKEVEISISNLVGQQFFHKHDHPINQSINLSYLHTRTYIIRVLCPPYTYQGLIYKN